MNDYILYTRVFYTFHYNKQFTYLLTYYTYTTMPFHLFYMLQKDEEDKQFLQYCSLCEGYKSPRSHHCRKCDRYYFIELYAITRHL
jgi:ribosomal protein L40E